MIIKGNLILSKKFMIDNLNQVEDERVRSAFFYPQLIEFRSNEESKKMSLS
jgi:hypothetical protein